VARQFNLLELEYCTFESDVKYAFFVLQVLLLDRNIDVRISPAREIDMRVREIRPPPQRNLAGPRATRCQISRCVLHLCTAMEPKKTSFDIFSEKLLNVPRLCPR
jgi:hypothetical protein